MEPPSIASRAGLRVAGVDEALRAQARKSSKTFCLRVQVAGAVPVLAELAAAAEVRHRVDAALLEPHAAHRRSRWAAG